MPTRLPGALWPMYFLVFLWVTVIPPNSVAQTHSVQGHVYDRNGAPVVGANVVITGTLFGTVTSASGDFHFKGVREGEYDLNVFHSEFEAWSSTLVVVDSDVDSEIILNPARADLNILSIDGTRTISEDWNQRFGRHRTTRDAISGRIPGVDLVPRIFDLSIVDLPGIVSLTSSTTQLHSMPSIDVLSRFLQSEVAATIRPFESREQLPSLNLGDEAQDAYAYGSHLHSFVTAGYSGNGGGPVLSGRYRHQGSPIEMVVDLGYQKFLADYRAEDDATVSAFGRRLISSMNLQYRLGSRSAFTVGAAVSSGVKIPYPTIDATLADDFHGDYRLGYRRKLGGAISFVDIEANVSKRTSSWTRSNELNVDMRHLDDFSDSGGRVTTSVGVGSALFFDASIRSRSLEASSVVFRMAEPTLSFSTIPDARKNSAQVGGRYVFAVADARSIFQVHGHVSQYRSAQIDEPSRIESTLIGGDVSFGVHSSLPGKWEGGILAELDVIPPPLELFYANDLPVTRGQYQGRVKSRSPKSTRIFSLRFDLDRDSKWAHVELSAAVANEQNALTVSPSGGEGPVGPPPMEIDNVDLLTAHVYGRSTSSLRDIVFLEIAGSVRLGTVTSNEGANQNTAAHAIPASSFGTNMIVKTPAGGSYWRVSSTAYLKQGRINDRLSEQQTPGALVFDSGIGYRKDQLSIELKLDNIFDQLYWHHNRPTSFTGYRIPAKGRSLGFQLQLAL